MTICDVGGGVKPYVTSHVRKFTAGAWSFAGYPYKQSGPKIVFSDTKCAVDFVKCAVDFAGVCYVK